MKLPQYVEGVLQYLGRMEQEHVGTPAQDAYDRMRKELIEESLTAKNPVAKEVANPPPVKPTKTSGGTFNMCAACAKKWEHGTEPTDDPCLQHRYGFNGCVCENNSHFDSLNLLEKETTAILEKREKEREQLILKIISRMENGEKVHLKKDMASRVLAHVDIKGHKLTGDLEVIQDEPGFVRMFFKGAALRKSGLVKNNPRRSDGMSPNDFDQEQLYNGTQHEKEHTDDVKEAQRIAMDHLAEDPNYYINLEKCMPEKSGDFEQIEDSEPEETWVDDEEEPVEESNPTRPTVSELTKVFRGVIKDPISGKESHGFYGSTLGRNLSEKEREEVWRDIQLFIQKMVAQMMEKVMGLSLKRKDGRPGALEFAQKEALTKGESKEEIEENRYYKLFLTSYLMSLLQHFFYISPKGIKAAVNELEGGKTWRQKAQFSNREADAKATYLGMISLMARVRPLNLAVWFGEHEEEVKKIYAESEKEWKKIQDARGKIGAKKLAELERAKIAQRKEISAMKPVSMDDKAGSKSESAKTPPARLAGKIVPKTEQLLDKNLLKEKLKGYKKPSPDITQAIARLAAGTPPKKTKKRE